MELYRFASCVDDKDEGLAAAYFATARHLHREDEPLRLLTGRFHRFGARSSLPARTLHWTHWELDHDTEAAAVLDEATRLRPQDGEMLLYAAGAFARAGEFDRADEWLEQARGHCRHADWLRAAANLASNQDDLAGALKLWREVLEAEPAALDANRAAARLLAETEGRPAALEHLARACEQSQHNYALHRALID